MSTHHHNTQQRNTDHNNTHHHKIRQQHSGLSKGIVLGLITGGIVGIIITLTFVKLAPSNLLSASHTNQQSDFAEQQAQPLYWVAPMDANFRRDKPGKSPMGMDLIPYYGNNLVPTADKGTIKISPNVINNLGVRTTKVTYEVLKTNINTLGYITVNEDKLIHIHPRVAGWIEKLHINAVGENVIKGQPLYDIYSPALVNAQEELLLALASKNQALITAAENRLNALNVPSNTLKHLKKHRKVQQNITFYAPQSGVIESLLIRSGFYVEPETMMLAIVNLDKVWVKAEVFEADIFKLSVGDNAIVSLDYQPNQQWQGKVQHIHPMLNPNTRTGIARLQVDNPLGVLKPNMFAQVSIENHNNNTPVLQLPRDAIIRTGNQDRVVLALGEGYFKSVAVTLGRSNRHNIEIISGVVAGDRVVSAAQFLLDSESSKQSDFKRMHSDADDIGQHHTPDLMHEHKMNTNQPLSNKPANTVSSTTLPSSTVSAETVPSAMVHGTVVSVKPEQRQVTINREAIAKWHREAATVTFTVNEAVDMSVFTKDAYLMFTFEVRPDDFVIINAMVMHEGMSHNMHHGESHD